MGDFNEYLSIVAETLRNEQKAQTPSEEQRIFFDETTLKFILRLKSTYPMYWSALKILNHGQGALGVKECIKDVQKRYGPLDLTIGHTKPNAFMIAKALRLNLC